MHPMPENGVRHARPPAEPEPLATSRPWLTVAGCLGGGAVAAALAVLLVAAAAILVLFPDLLTSRTPGERFIAAVGELRKAPALRVATREIAVRVEVSLPREFKLRLPFLPFGPAFEFEAGRTTVAIVAPENVVQYVVPLGDASGHGDRTPDTRESEATDGEGAWIVVLPPPRLDESLVEVQSDPRRLSVEVDRDWADHLLGDDRAREEALAAIREAVVREASSETATFEVREKARATVAEMIRALLPEDLRSRAIRVRWTDEPAEDAGG